MEYEKVMQLTEAEVLFKYLKVDRSHIPHFFWKRNAFIHHVVAFLYANICLQEDTIQFFSFKHLYQCLSEHLKEGKKSNLNCLKVFTYFNLDYIHNNLVCIYYTKVIQKSHTFQKFYLNIYPFCKGTSDLKIYQVILVNMLYKI